MPPVAGTVRGLDLTLTDARGVIVARVKAQSGAVGRTGVDTGAAGAVQRAVATLYEQGKASAVITGDQIAADQATRMISGKGNVVARSLVQPGSPTVRADAMTWRPDQHKIRGQGNVVLTRQPNVRVAGDRFEADTRLRHFRITNDAPPVAVAR